MMFYSVLLAALRGSIILVAAGVVTIALRSKPAALRHAVWTLAIACQLTLPLLALVMPQRSVVVGPIATYLGRAAVVAPPTRSTPAIDRSTSPNTGGAAAAVTTAPAISSPSPDFTTLAGWLGVLWATGALLVLLRFLVGTVLVARETRQAKRPIRREWILLAGRIQEDMQLRRPAKLVWGTKREVPYTWGIVQPVICLPADADTWSEERLRIVLTHELAHIERFDALTEFMAQLALVAFWFNPLLWVGVRRMRAEREHACDDRVLTRGTRPSTYVEELVNMMKSIGQGAIAPGFGAIAMARRSQFESRMFAVLDDNTDRRRISGRSLAFVSVVALAGVLAVASVRPASAAPRVVAVASASRIPAAASRWGQSDFDDLVADCRRPKTKMGARYCDVRTVDVGALTGAVSFEGGYLDGAIFTSDRALRTPVARALVRAEALTPEDARKLAGQVTTTLKNGVLRSERPGGGRSSDWSVIYEVTLPPGRNVKARTDLGQIGLTNFQGNADIAAVNGPLQVFGSAGDIKGRTESGPLFVGLGGERWEGAGLDLQSRNGPIYVSIPAGYSGHLITGTTNGPLDLSYPVLVRRMTSKRIDADIGAGGPTVRITTLNGPADIR